MLSDRDNIVGGELELRTGDNVPLHFKISISDDLNKGVYELASTLRANMRDLKGEVEQARRRVRYNPVNLQPYKEYLDVITEIYQFYRSIRVLVGNFNSLNQRLARRQFLIFDPTS